MVEYIVLFALVIFIFILLNWFIKWKAYGQKENMQKKAQEARKKAAAKGFVVNCPMCNTVLLPGENLISRVYRPMNVPDQLCTISGCPHCYPVPEAGIKRQCPVCGKNVPLGEGHLTARLFNYADGKKHVVVTGCTECCKKSVK